MSENRNFVAFGYGNQWIWIIILIIIVLLLIPNFGYGNSGGYCCKD